MLEALERELVQVVVDCDDLHLYHRVVLEELQHQLRVDQTTKVENEVRYRYLRLLQLVLQGYLYIGLKRLGKVGCVEFLDALGLDRVKVLAIVLAQVAHQVLVDHLVADNCRAQLAQLEFDGVLVEHSLRRFLQSAQRPDVKYIWRAHVVD